MNAETLLFKVVKALHQVKLEAVLIGNAAAALHGAPVTTLDFDFMFRKCHPNLAKLKRFSSELGATILKPYYPVSELYRVVNEDCGLQVDFMGQIHGISSFASLRSRAEKRLVGGLPMWLADLADILHSKRAAGRARDRAVMEILQTTLHEKEAAKKRQAEGSQKGK